MSSEATKLAHAILIFRSPSNETVIRSAYIIVPATTDLRAQESIDAILEETFVREPDGLAEHTAVSMVAEETYREHLLEIAALAEWARSVQEVPL